MSFYKVYGRGVEDILVTVKIHHRIALEGGGVGYYNYYIGGNVNVQEVMKAEGIILMRQLVEFVFWSIGFNLFSKGLISMIHSHKTMIHVHNRIIFAPPPECDLNLKFEEGAHKRHSPIKESVSFYG